MGCSVAAGLANPTPGLWAAVDSIASRIGCVP